MSEQSHDMGTLAACRAYFTYSNLLEEVPPNIDITESQGATLSTLGKRVMESRPNDLVELAAKMTAIKHFYEGADYTEVVENIAGDIRRLAAN